MFCEPTSLNYLEYYLRSGKLLLLPTDTVYGLFGLISSVQEMRALKNRSGLKTFAVFVALDLLDKFFILSSDERQLCERFMPGPVTVLLRPRGPSLLKLTRNGLVGVRIPDCQFFGQLLKTLGRPLLATSANLSGQKAPGTLRLVNRQIVEHKNVFTCNAPPGSTAPSGEASAVVRVLDGKVSFLRRGNTNLSEQIEEMHF